MESLHLPEPGLTLVYRLEATVGEPVELGEVGGGHGRIVPLREASPMSAPVAIITGASQGIGAGLVSRLPRRRVRGRGCRALVAGVDW